jgi:hypothetical protein
MLQLTLSEGEVRTAGSAHLRFVGRSEGRIEYSCWFRPKGNVMRSYRVLIGPLNSGNIQSGFWEIRLQLQVNRRGWRSVD